MLEHFQNAILGAAMHLAFAKPSLQWREMFRRVDSLLVTPFLDISHACCVKLSSALVSWQQPLLLAVSRESRDGTINASTNDNGIHRHEHFSRRLSSISRSLRISALSSISAALSLPLSLSLSTTFRHSALSTSLSFPLRCSIAFPALYPSVRHRNVSLSYRCMCTRDAFASRKCGWAVQRPARIPRVTHRETSEFPMVNVSTDSWKSFTLRGSP